MLKENLIPAHLKELAIKTSLMKMFKGNHFDICDFKSCAKLAGIRVPTEIHDFLHPLHCINWVDMNEDLVKGILDCIGHTFDQEALGLDIIKKIKLRYPKDADFEDTESDFEIETKIEVKPGRLGKKLVKALTYVQS